jgi:hypothetical protein
VNLNPKKLSSAVATAMVLFSLSGWASAAGGTYYRWIDASGTEVNSDRPPPAGIEYETIATSTNQQVEKIPGEETTAAEGKPAQTGDAGPETTPAQPTAIKDPEACAIAQQNLETLNSHARIRMPDEEGNFRYLNEDEKAAERVKAEAAIKQNCK